MQSFFWILFGIVFIWGYRTLFSFGGQHMNVAEFQKIWKDGAGKTTDILIDVREPDEFKSGHAPGARNIPLGEVANRCDELKSFKTIYVICLSGGRSANACGLLQKALSPDVAVINIDGGTNAWIGYGFPVEKGSAGK